LKNVKLINHIIMKLFQIEQHSLYSEKNNDND
jgi:hypothetical protein